MDEQFSNNHYIRINDHNHIIYGFSDVFHRPESTDILITDKGGRHFRLFHDGEDNPPLFNDSGISLYKWNGTRISPRTKKELNADQPTPPPSMPTLSELYERINEYENRLYNCELEIVALGGTLQSVDARRVAAKK